MRSKQGLTFIFAIKIAYIIDDANYIEINHLINLTWVISGFAMQNHSGTYSDWPEFAGAKERARKTTQPCNAIPLNLKQQ